MSQNRWNMRGLRAAALGAAGTALRVLLVFLLAFGTALYAETQCFPQAFAVPDGSVQVQDADGEDASPEGDEPGDTGGTGQDSGGQGSGQPPGGNQGGGQGEGDDEPANPGGGGQQDPPDNPQPGQDQPGSISVIDIGIFPSGSANGAYATARVPNGGIAASITRRGGYLDFNGALQLSDGSWEYQSNRIRWSLHSDDGSIAQMGTGSANNEFRLQAAGTDDGVVALTAAIDGECTQDGRELAATVYVQLAGQTETRYVTGVAICDESGNLMETYVFEEGTLATASVELNALVAVYDPATDSQERYLVTPALGLSQQTGGEVADLRWESVDPRLGYVSDAGEYRPLLEGTNQVRAYSTAGFNGTNVEAAITIGMPGEESGNYNPQDTLTVKWYYEQDPDPQASMEKNSKTYSIADLEALGTATYTYTAVRGTSGYLTTTGRGPLLATLLKDSVGTVEGIARLEFGTPDNYALSVSWDMLVDQRRYYFPDIDVNSFAVKYQVPPIIAIESHRNSGTDTAPHADMDSQRRFLLLFGSKDTGEVISKLQVYNIHTLYVVLAGKPPVEQGGGGTPTPTPPGTEAPTKDPGKKPGEDPRSPSGSSSSSASREDGGRTPGTDPANPTDGQGHHDLKRAGDAAAAKDAGSTSAEAAAGASGGAASPGIQVLNTGKWSMLQAINRHPANVAELMYANPFAPYALPLAIGVFAAGMVEVLVRFRWQKRPAGTCVAGEGA